LIDQIGNRGNNDPASGCRGETNLRKGTAGAFGAAFLAFMATQHHNVHMALFTIGLGGFAGSFMTENPTLRRAMLAMSAAMIGVILYRGWRHRPTGAQRVVAAASAAFAIAVLLWSISQFGL
jgi:hypothetical protein